MSDKNGRLGRVLARRLPIGNAVSRSLGCIPHRESTAASRLEIVRVSRCSPWTGESDELHDAELLYSSFLSALNPNPIMSSRRSDYDVRAQE